MYVIDFYALKKGVWVAAIVSTLAGNVCGQSNRSDSLQSLIAQNPGLEKYDPLISLVRLHASMNAFQASYQYAQDAHAIALAFGDTSKIVNSSRIIGQLLNRLDRPTDAELVLTETVPIAKRNNLRSEYKLILNSLASSFITQAKYDRALQTNFEVLRLREEDKEQAEVSLSLNNIGIVYFKLRNYEKALEFYHRALDLKKEIGDEFFLDHLFVNIGLCYNQLSDFSRANYYFNSAFKQCAAECSEQLKKDGGFGLGVSFYGLNRLPEAIERFNESYAIAKRIGDKRFQAENLIYLAHIYVKQQDLDKAINALRMCEQISSTSGYNEILIETYKEFASVFYQMKDHEKASSYQSKYIVLKDSIYSAELIDKIAQIQTNYAERENLKTIANKNEVIARQRSLNIAIVIIALLAALLVFVLFRSNRTKKKVNQALSDAKAIIEDQNRQLLSSNYSLNQELKEKNIELQKANESLLRVNEELDNFIYKTSHDIRGPLASLKGMCNVALMDVSDPLALSYLHKLDITAEKLNTILTRLLIVNQINNSTLASEKIDFAGIVNDVLTLEKKKGLPPRLKIKKHIDSDISFHSDRQFVRIILENLIDNAIKFYNDSERVDPFVSIDVTEKDDHIRIKVVDNGIGVSEVHPEKIFQMFSRASERSETGGIGLYITKTATEKLGGSVNLKTTPEGFTEFFVTLPLASTRVMA